MVMILEQSFMNVAYQHPQHSLEMKLRPYDKVFRQLKLFLLR